MSSTATASAPAPTTARGGPRLRGLAWLVWRQHRAAFRTGIVLTVLCAAWFAYRRWAMLDFLRGAGWPEVPYADYMDGFVPYMSRLMESATTLGVFVPALVGVFVGAPLFAHDLEHGTGKLVLSQTVGRGRWVATKLGMPLLLAAVCTALLSAVYGWWLAPVAEADSTLYWETGAAAGPVPVALTLFTLTAGAAIGMVLRRTLLSMVVSFGLATAVQYAWSSFWTDLGDPVSVTSRAGVDAFPDIPAAANQLEQWYLTGSGERIGWGSCAEATEKATDACLAEKDVVGWAVDYLPASELTPVLWTGSAILFALTAAVAAFVVLWGRKRLF
ncbi:ABC transporter [Streptomyces sp. NPDC048845]|uniref:ABC transporter permease subunit n=1 Tax=Streptomyces sp. NPDC048845 TaxID=3155390 RepID=UPI00342E7AC4